MMAPGEIYFDMVDSESVPDQSCCCGVALFSL